MSTTPYRMANDVMSRRAGRSLYADGGRFCWRSNSAVHPMNADHLNHHGPAIPVEPAAGCARICVLSSNAAATAGQQAAAVEVGRVEAWLLASTTFQHIYPVTR